MFVDNGITWRVDNIMALLNVVSKSDGVFFIQVRSSKFFSVAGYQNAFHKWRNKFLWVKPATGTWPVKSIVAAVDTQVFKRWGRTDAIEHFYRSIDATYILLDLEKGTLEAAKDGGEPSTLKRRAAEAGPEESTERAAEDELPQAPAKKAKGPLTVALATAGAEAASGGSPSESQSSSAPMGGDGAEPEAAPRRREGKEPAGEEDAAAAADPAGASVDAGKDPSEKGYWFDSTQGVFSLRFNDDFNYIPQCEASDLPEAVLEALHCREMERYMSERGEGAMIKLQAHLSLASAMIGRELGRAALDRRGELAEAVNINKTWRSSYNIKKRQLAAAAKELLEKGGLLKAAEDKVAIQELDLASKEAELKSTSDDASMKTILLHTAEAKVKLLEADLDNKSRLMQTVAAELDSEQSATAGLRNTLAQQAEERAAERASWEMEKAAMLQALQETRSKLDATLQEKATAEAAGPTAISAAEGLTFEEVYAATLPPPEGNTESLRQAQEAVDRYKDSDDFYADMGEFQEIALGSLRRILVEDGKLTEEEAAAYTYEVCMTR